MTEKLAEKLIRAIKNDDEVLFNSLNITSELVNRQFQDNTLLSHYNEWEVDILEGVTPLHIVVEHGRLQFARTLLQLGASANVNASTLEHVFYSPLSIACLKNDTGMVDLLLEFGADANIVKSGECGNRKRGTPLQSAVLHANVSMVKSLLDAGADDKNKNYLPLLFRRTWQGQQSGKFEIARLLCERGCSVNEANDDNFTPLFMAVTNENAESTKFLIEQLGADPNVVTDRGNALNMAVSTYEPSKDVIELLISHGTQLNIADWRHRVPLQQFLEGRKIKDQSSKDAASIVQTLIQHGTILNQGYRMETLEDTFLDNAFYLLYGCNNFHVLKMLSRGGMDLPFFRDFVKDPGTQLSEDEGEDDLKEFLDFAKLVVSVPRPLADLSCFYIRDFLISLGDGSSIKSAIFKLPVPEPIHNFLFLEHL